MEAVRHIWATLEEHIRATIEHARNIPSDQLYLVAALACFAFLVTLAAWIGTQRKLRSVRNKYRKAKAELEELQAKYGGEVRWRTSADRVQAAQAARNASRPAALANTVQQLAGAGTSAAETEKGLGSPK